jgi:ribulose-phosphate 3-epimerase
MPSIVPAILPSDFDELAASLTALRGITKLVQIDVVDGVFAPAQTWPYGDEDRLARILAEEEGLPYWEQFSYEADLMVHHARRDAEAWVSAGASRVIIHAESKDADAALEYLQPLREGVSFIVEAGIALSLQTPLETLERFKDQFDFVQLMGIARIGRQGEALDELIYARIQALRADYQGTISIDGGVKADNARKLVEAGATQLVAGSAILAAEDPREAYRALRVAAQL